MPAIAEAETGDVEPVPDHREPMPADPEPVPGSGIGRGLPWVWRF